MNNHEDELPTIALLLTENSAGLLNAALAHYRTYLRRNDSEELQRVAPQLEELHRALIDEVRQPSIPKIDVEAIAALSLLNQAKSLASEAPHDVSLQHRTMLLFSSAHAKLVELLTIPVHYSNDKWHFGREAPRIR